MSPMPIIRKAKALARRWGAPVLFWGRARRCPICGTNLRRFLPLGRVHLEMSAKWGFSWPLERFETLNLQEYYCPACCEPDRARLIATWIQRWIDRRPSATPWRLLDFAPGTGLQRFLRALPGVVYRSADMYMPEVDDHVDITRMPYPDGSFDAFICSHVLEHVHQDGVALRELRRVLKPGGWGVLLVPIPLDAEQTDEETAEEAKAATEAERWRRFGQGDHVRLYARSDFVARIRDAGFTCTPFDITMAGADTFARAGITPSAVLYVVEHPVPGAASAPPPHAT